MLANLCKLVLLVSFSQINIIINRIVKACDPLPFELNQVKGEFIGPFFSVICFCGNSGRNQKKALLTEGNGWIGGVNQRNSTV